MNRSIEMPDDLMATSSEVSPRLPKVIMEANRIPNGSAMGTNVVESNPRNLTIVRISNPLPINSSIHTHINCITKINHVTKNAPMNGGKKDWTINLCNDFKQNGLRKNKSLHTR